MKKRIYGQFNDSVPILERKGMRKIIVWSIIIHALSALILLAQQPDAQMLLRSAEGLIGGKEKSVIADITIYIKKGGKKIKEVRYLVYYKGHNKTLVKQIEPENVKGNAILMLDNNMWFHARGNKRSIRITPQQRLIGGASNADIAKIGFSFDYDATIAGKDTLQGEVCYVLQLTAKENHLPYQKVRVWISQKNIQLKKAELFAVSGKKLKTIFYGTYRQFAGDIQRPGLIKIQDHLFGKDKITVIQYHSIKPVKIPDKYFNMNYLVHIK